MRRLIQLRTGTEGSALLEFAIVLPLLVVFVVGIYDFSGAYNQKQKIEHAAQAGAATAAGQPTGDMDSSAPDSLQPALSVVFNSLAADKVLPLANQGSCAAAAAVVTPAGGVAWTYTISGCSAFSADSLIITIDRGVVGSGVPAAVGTAVTVSFPYHWRFNSVIQLLIPGASYAATTDLRQTATVHSQM
jgi:Flp pilus assembly protein TadG